MNPRLQNHSSAHICVHNCFLFKPGTHEWLLIPIQISFKVQIKTISKGLRTSSTNFSPFDTRAPSCPLRQRTVSCCWEWATFRGQLPARNDGSPQVSCHFSQRDSDGTAWPGPRDRWLTWPETYICLSRAKAARASRSRLRARSSPASLPRSSPYVGHTEKCHPETIHWSNLGYNAGADSCKGRVTRTILHPGISIVVGVGDWAGSADQKDTYQMSSRPKCCAPGIMRDCLCSGERTRDAAPETGPMRHVCESH